MVDIPREERTYAVLDHYDAAGRAPDGQEWLPVLVLGMPNSPDEGSPVTVIGPSGDRWTTSHARVINYVEDRELESGEAEGILCYGFSYSGESTEDAERLAAEAVVGVMELASSLGQE